MLFEEHKTPSCNLCKVKQEEREGRFWCLGFRIPRGFVNLTRQSLSPFAFIPRHPILSLTLMHAFLWFSWLQGICIIYTYMLYSFPFLQGLSQSYLDMSAPFFLFNISESVRALLLRLALGDDGRNFRFVPLPRPSVWSIWEKEKYFMYLKNSMAFAWFRWIGWWVFSLNLDKIYGIFEVWKMGI